MSSLFLLGIKVGLCIFLIQAILLITCQGSEEETVYGTFGVLTNFKDRTLNFTNITLWKVIAPLDHQIVVTVIYPTNDPRLNCENVRVKDAISSTDISSYTPSKEFCRFHIKNRIFALNLTGHYSLFLAVFEAFRNQIKVETSYPVSTNESFSTKVYNYTLSERETCHKLNKNSISVENRSMNYFHRALLMRGSEYTWINTSNTVFTSWASHPNAHQGCARMNKTGNWETVQNCFTNDALHVCQERVSQRSTFYDQCKESLGLQQGNGEITDHTHHSADNARLNKTGWILPNSQSDSWIKVKFSKTYIMTGVATQGVESHGWVVSFSISFQALDSGMVPLKNARNQNIVFQANTDSYNVVFNRIEPVISTKEIKLRVKEWHNKIALRMELYGCEVDASTCRQRNLGMENNAIKDDQIHSPSSNNLAKYARLNLDLRSPIVKSCWTTSDPSPWLQVDLKSSYYITAVLTQGCGFDYTREWVKKYKISYGNYPSEMVDYKVNGTVKEFDGNTDRSSVKVNHLNPIIVTQMIRIYPIDSNYNNSMRIELQGCDSSNPGFESLQMMSWGAWSECNATCNGTRQRNRTCNVVPDSQCQGLVDYESCDRVDFCKNFSDWSTWTPCSNSCGPGEQRRSRIFTGSYQGKSCSGSLTIIRDCNGTCEITYGNWSDWSKCNMTCGIGFQERTRNCTTYKPNQTCSNGSTEIRICNLTYSVISPPLSWSPWSPWSVCNETCGIYSQTQRRNTTDQLYQEISSRECKPCLPCMCPWTNWTECSCNTPNQTRTMNCTYTEARHLNCSGTTNETRPCNLTCPVHGNFTNWSNWTSCSVTCGNGTQYRNRSCSKPPPSNGGNPCSGNSNETRTCTIRPCPVDGNFTNWSNWTSCSATCGNGTQHRNRSCTNPLPAHGGNNCTGHTNETKFCNIQLCPVDGNFTNWSNWTSCSVTCDKGTKHRNRSCTKPPPAHGGNNCTGPYNETQSCEIKPCSVDGNFTNWSNWTSCSVTCGNGTQHRNRSCTNPLPAHGGNNCTGHTNETKICQIAPCPVNGSFSSWTFWTQCTLTCGNGTQERMRTCTNPAPAHGGKNCSGHVREKRNCNTESCPKIPVDGGFASWGDWSKCTLTCDTGSQHRERTCTEPPPANNGDNCTGEFIEKKICNTNKCPIDGKWTTWSAWSDCNRPCGDGSNNRTRTCSSPSPQYGGKDCVGNNSESRICHTGKSCPAAKISVIARFTDETFSNKLKTRGSKEWKNLRDKILENVKALYVDQSIVEGIDVKSFSNGSVVSNFDINFKKMDSTQLIILQESIEVDKMLNNMSLQTPTINATKVPNARPSVTLKVLSSTSIHANWTMINKSEYNSQKLKGYSVFYKENSQEKYSLNQMMAFQSPSILNATIKELKKYTHYALRVLAYTDNGNGIASDPVLFRTDEDVPSRSPEDFTVSPTSSTALMTKWKTIPNEYRHGKLLGYRIVALNTKTGAKKTYEPGQHRYDTDITGLDKFAEYSVTICGFTSKGCGFTAQQTTSTLEDLPSMPPKDAVSTSFLSTTEIEIRWAPVPHEGRNGIIREYIITYNLYSQGQSRVFETQILKKFVKPSVYKLKIGGLKPYSKYEFRIAARNTRGVGPFQKFYGETCRCPKEIFSNYWFITPYFNSTSSGQVTGIFSHIVEKMLKWSCGDCKNGHRETKVNFQKDGNGSKALKKSILDVAGNVDNGAQISFPINGNKDMNRIYGNQVFIPLVESPGVAYLVIPVQSKSTAMNVVNSIIGSIPFLLFSMGLAYLAGVIIWFLDARHTESVFPRKFSLGVFEGLWWSFISMTTVGYGDRSPVSFLSRWFAIIWTLYGMTLVSILTSTMSSSLTTVSLQTRTSIYGTQIAAIQNSSEHRIGILKNGKINQVTQYHSVSDILDALNAHEVRGALIDTYVVAAKSQKFTDAGISVAKMLDRPFGYGLVLSSEIANLESECLQYLHTNAESISRLIEISTQKLTVPSLSESNTKDTKLFDASSHLFQNTLIFVTSMLGLAVLCGLVWHFTCHKKEAKVSPVTVEMLSQKELTVRKMRAFVDKFHQQAMSKMNEMRARHHQEKLKLYRRIKEREKQNQKVERAQAKAARLKAKKEDPDGMYSLSDLVKLATNMVRS